jgi:hypothetical protein
LAIDPRFKVFRSFLRGVAALEAIITEDIGTQISAITSRLAIQVFGAGVTGLIARCLRRHVEA